MTNLQVLNHMMLALEKQGHLAEQEYATYKTLLEAVDLLEILRYSMSQYDDGEWFLHEGADELIAQVDDFLEKLK